jgi:hypothetical protein
MSLEVIDVVYDILYDPNYSRFEARVIALIIEIQNWNLRFNLLYTVYLYEHDSNTRVGQP